MLAHQPLECRQLTGHDLKPYLLVEMLELAQQLFPCVQIRFPRFLKLLLITCKTLNVLRIISFLAVHFELLNLLGVVISLLLQSLSFCHLD
jgi:hypothetical protein